MTEGEAWHARFRAMVGAVSGVVWTNNAAGEMTGEQPAWSGLTGQTRDEYQGYGWGKAVHPDDAQPTIEAWNAAVADRRPFEFEHRVRRFDGEWRLFQIRAVPVLDRRQEIVEWVGIHTDITERRQAEAALIEGRARLQAIVDTAPVSIVFAEAPSGRLVFGNAGIERVFRHPMRYSSDVSEYFKWEAYHSDGRRVEGHEFPAARSVTTGESATGEFQFVCGDGVRRWIEISSAPVREPGGRIAGAVVVCSDVDELRQAQIVLFNNQRELERLVEIRTRELAASQAQLAHALRMDALGRLAGGIAHDFNNVIQAVQGGARLIERRATDPQEVRKLAGMIGESAARAASITRRLLSFSRQGDLRAEPIDAAPLLAGMQEILAHTLGAGIRVQVEVQDGLPLFLADKSQLETVLVNLATNARDALQGEGVLTLSAAAEVVRDSRSPGQPATLTPGSYVRLSVADTGSGMAPAVLAKASEPFFTTKEIGRGTGLGLAMSRGFAEQSGGTLQIDSELGRGTRVTLWFPVEHGASPTKAASLKTRSRAAGRARARLLIVDDDPSVLQTLAQQLEAEEFVVLTATSGADALATLERGEIVDLVISDLSMPLMDGLALLREVKRRQPGLPAILLTGFVTGAVELAMSDAVKGAFALLRKPIEAQLLSERIALMLDAAV